LALIKTDDPVELLYMPLLIRLKFYWENTQLTSFIQSPIWHSTAAKAE